MVAPAVQGEPEEGVCWLGDCRTLHAPDGKTCQGQQRDGNRGKGHPFSSYTENQSFLTPYPPFTYSTVLRKPNRYIDDAAARIFPPAK